MIKKILLVAFIAFSSLAMVGQTTVTGTVKDAKTGDLLPGANIKISRRAVGTSTDFDGNFVLIVTDKPPFTIEISMIGFHSITAEITKNNQKVEVSLKENETSLDEIVVSASRTPERIMESPVTIERMDARSIKNTSAPSFYDGLENLKGVDVNTNSLTFKSVNTRGFATFSNTRFMQLVDGMDNSSPALNFALGNLLGMSELDVKTVELLPGASSALYGANAFNGIMFMTSKSPFEDQGISVSLKGGITSQDAGGNNEFTDFNLRMAYAFSDKFAAKATLAVLQGTDWFATDYRNTADGEYAPGTRESVNDYNGVNVYGDVAATDLGGAIGRVSRTGYNETDLMDYDVESVKFLGALHYRPFGDDRLEIIWNSKLGTGTTQYLGGQKYAIKNFFMEQHKLELKGKNFFVRGYVTAEDAGDSYNTLFTALNINREWSGDTNWFTEYAGAYLTTGSHQAARSYADRNRLLPGTAGFKEAFNKVTSDANLITGSKFRDETKLYHGDANYNFQDVIDFAELQIGGSYRRYSLNSFGNIFTDTDGPIDYDEYGIYTQVQKNFLDEDRLKVTASLRYDKAQNFDGNFSPRVSFAYAGGENKNQNFRASFQTGFRNPTTQDQYIGLDVGNAILVGGVEDNIDRYSTTFTDPGDGQTYTLTGRDAYENSYTLASGGTVKADLAFVKPEKVTAYEIGYRGLVNTGDSNRFTVDLSVYYNQYEDFIANTNVIVPYNLTGGYKVFQLYANSTADISSYGASIGLNTKILDGFDVGFNYTLAKFEFDQASNPDFEAGFNTPEHKVKLQFGKTDLFKNFGFNINARWQDKYRWESTFLDGTIEARTVLDAQINYSVPSLKSVFKLGGANLTGQEYLSAPGVGAIGSQYYLSWTINN
ncbi:Outer membrane receptor proteins, mostly Fe transport [Polaribacter sp. KT25b]|uniref:TonB-dependent receptor n=1 Tax=Polaribacter sp. KT25b TaxID=1855336 RepID=UPI00087A47C2|nr:TonB-dependent receptor [Polaribacter sp. KT25b]SDS53801.1 Outer membrane receptor proteins, mostly Fe transport [Polaribacter sp. KT25b]